MAYVGPFTYEIIKVALEACAPSFTLKDNFFSKLIYSVSYTLQGNVFIIPSIAGAILPEPGLQSPKYSIFINHERMVVNSFLHLVNYDWLCTNKGSMAGRFINRICLNSTSQIEKKALLINTNSHNTFPLSFWSIQHQNNG